MTSEIAVRVIGEAPYWYDSNLANDEPSCQIYGFECTAATHSSIRRIQFGFCVRPGWEREEDRIQGFDELRLFRSIRIGDELTVTFEERGHVRSPVVLSTIRGHVNGRGPALYPHHDQSVELLKVRNENQGWEIREAIGPVRY